MVINLPIRRTEKYKQEYRKKYSEVVGQAGAGRGILGVNLKLGFDGVGGRDTES